MQTFENSNGVQYGYAVKLVAELGTGKKNTFIWRAGLSGGVGSFFGKNWFYPAFHSDLMLYQGGIGSRWPGSTIKHFNVEINLSYSVTLGTQYRFEKNHFLRPEIRNYPLYYFSNFVLPPLQNPYNWSVTWGGNSIFHVMRKKGSIYQMVGFINIHGDRFQISYINDGPPFFPPFGDKFDRMHTGGFFLSFHGNKDWPLDLLELGFNKFTGYSNNAYELSNKIGNGYVYHKDENEQYYNKSRIYLNLANTSKGYGIGLNLYNKPNWDIQHKIHLSNFYVLHMVPYSEHIAFSAMGYFQRLKIGIK